MQEACGRDFSLADTIGLAARVLPSLVDRDSKVLDMKVSRRDIVALMMSPELRARDDGRKFVLLSLAEAETIRCLLHLRTGRALLPGTDMAGNPRLS